jgi:hypothetical protein
MKIISKVLRSLIIWTIFLSMHVWAGMALYFCAFPSDEKLRLWITVAYAAVTVLVLIVHRFRRKGLIISLFFFITVAMWFRAINPKQHGDYPEHLRMPSAELNGDYVTVHNVRNCDYGMLQDFDVRYESRRFDLSQLESVDLLVNYRGPERAAHSFLSFGFKNGTYVAVSAENRPELTEAYDILKGFFKQYELIYIWADERDLVRLHTNYLDEDVYLFRIYNVDQQVIRKLFISVLNRTMKLARFPEFYDAFQATCMNTIDRHMIEAHVYDIPLWQRSILTGTIDVRLYNEGFLDTNVPFVELRRAAQINDRAKAADQDKEFSAKIRTHLEKQIVPEE